MPSTIAIAAYAIGIPIVFVWANATTAPLPITVNGAAADTMKNTTAETPSRFLASARDTRLGPAGTGTGRVSSPNALSDNGVRPFIYGGRRARRPRGPPAA